MKRKNLLKILGLLILAGNVASAKYLGKLEKTYSKNSDYKMKITSVKSGESKRNVSKILSDQEIDLELIEKIGDSNYFRNKNGIYYKSGEKVLKLDGVDKDSFEVMEFGNYGKDKNNIYYEGEKIEKIDPKSAKIFGSHFVKDEKIVFDADEKKELKDVDTKTLKSVGDYYFKDKNNAYFDMKKIDEKVDLETFVYLDFFYARDKNNLYFYGQKVKGVSPNNFEFWTSLSSVPDNIIKSGNDFYLVYENNSNEKIYAKKMDFPIDKDTFESFSMRVYKDKNNFYYYDETDDIKKGKTLIKFKNEADIKTLKFLKEKNGEKSDEYIKDEKNVYYVDEENVEIKKIENADYKTFQVIEYLYAKDKNNVYYQGKKLNNVNPNYFKIVDNEIKYNNEFYKIDDNMNLIKIERE